MDDSGLRKILDASPDMYLVLDRDGALLDFSPSSTFEPASTPGNFLGRPLEKVLPADLAKAILDGAGKALEIGEERLIECTFPSDGTDRRYEVRFSTFGEDRVLVILRDMTELSGSEAAARALLDASHDTFLLLDRKGTIVSINSSGAGLYGKTPEQMEGTLYWDHLSPEKIDVRKKRMQGILESGEAANFVDISDGRVFEVSCNPVPGSSGKVDNVAFFIRDISEKVEAEQALIESEARYRRLFDDNPVPMYIYDTSNLRILEVNNALVDSYGYTREELTSMGIGEIRPAEDVSKVMENVNDLRSRQVYLGLWRHTKKDGTVIDVEITSGDFPYLNRPARLVLCNDVTEKVRIQKTLVEREEQYRHLFEYNPLPMMIIDPDSLKILSVNQAAINHYGFDKKEFLNLTVKDIRPREDVAEAVKLIRSLESPMEYLGVHRHMKRSGETILVDIISHEISFEGHKARLVLCNDVTEQIRARKALEESEVKFRSIVESSPMGIHMYVLDDEDRLIFSGYNTAADSILGIDHQPLIGLPLEEAFPGTEDLSIYENYRSVCLTGKPWNSENVNYEDDRVSGAFEVYAFQTGERSMSVLFLDITEKKRTEEAISESEEKFRKAFLTSPDPMTISSIEDGVLLEVNDGFVNTIGYSREECLGKSTSDIGLWKEEEDRTKLTAELRKKGRVVNFETAVRDREGRVRNALVSAAVLNIAGVPRMFTISRDITELKRTEEALIKSEEQLRASLLEKEMLLKEIHHRVKNNLQVISGLLDLQAQHISDPAGQSVFKESQNRVVTMALIHEELYQSANLSQVDFGEYIRNLCRNLMVSYGADRDRIRLEVDCEKIEMVVDTAIPCGLMINELITNSLKHAFPEGRTGTISLSFRQMRNREYQLTVEDDGVGIPKEVDIHSTTTLGMQLVTVLVGQLGGSLRVRRHGGTKVKIKFREYHEAGSVLY